MPWLIHDLEELDSSLFGVSKQSVRQRLTFKTRSKSTVSLFSESGSIILLVYPSHLDIKGTGRDAKDDELVTSARTRGAMNVTRKASRPRECGIIRRRRKWGSKMLEWSWSRKTVHNISKLNSVAKTMYLNARSPNNGRRCVRTAEHSASGTILWDDSNGESVRILIDQ